MVQSTKNLKDDLRGILGQIKDLTDNLKERALSLTKLSTDSSIRTEEVADAMESLAEQSNMAKEVSDLSTDLNDISENINKAVNRFHM
ncbi:hypothetical protein [Anaerocolumna sp.]|uniref:hypothetical protein n=1 Tax=Anaerocolumna sp. TaxID=2041569 RepID=UPI0028AF3C5B|nr:hypothetical protein [Anaerocolumna sp.]